MDAIKQVDVVISAVAIPQHLDQFNIIKAIKDVGIANIKVYTPLYTVCQDCVPSYLNTSKACKDERFQLDLSFICFDSCE